eukprot:CAMPEP_0185459656 /NCGR_PEP_ID=MMETSP1365-20130426/85399_1 /TAXON_ID=38817 /ORGANISM="Gephyrocapsa oceanica, Strain RCC1303" /LENGTH=137 /DNA_ID=CAMNT_0028066211 /DNA_START=172 /DNA_END=586 /DNA_ORIENTATION=+
MRSRPGCRCIQHPKRAAVGRGGPAAAKRRALNLAAPNWARRPAIIAAAAERVDEQARVRVCATGYVHISHGGDGRVDGGGRDAAAHAAAGALPVGDRVGVVRRQVAEAAHVASLAPALVHEGETDARLARRRRVRDG